MGQIERAGCMDVSNAVDVSSCAAVERAVTQLMLGLCPEFDEYTVRRLFADFELLYCGGFPGFHACDIRYHNAQHVLDVTLAMARLLDGLCRSEELLNPLQADDLLTGIAAALFHDSGYIRSVYDTAQSNGAAYTSVHVSRGARLLGYYLPQVGLRRLVDPCSRIIHFTGYEIDPRDIPVENETERLLGHLLGTADLIAQMADVDYINKCRDHLYAEFVAGGLASAPGIAPASGVIYQSPAHLLHLTPNFIDDAVSRRLDGYFRGVYRYAAGHFGGRNLYMEAIDDNRTRLLTMLGGSH